MAYFDSRGFYTTEVLEGRFTETEPDYLPAPDGLKWNWTGFKWVLMSDEPAPVPTPPAWQWYIDIGPFFDRFGALKISVLTSTDAVINAIIRDIQIRKWIDLKNPEVAQSLQYVGSKIPAVTPALQNQILNTPVADHENLALRKLYFS